MTYVEQQKCDADEVLTSAPPLPGFDPEKTWDGSDDEVPSEPESNVAVCRDLAVACIRSWLDVAPAVAAVPAAAVPVARDYGRDDSFQDVS